MNELERLAAVLREVNCLNWAMAWSQLLVMIRSVANQETERPRYRENDLFECGHHQEL